MALACPLTNLIEETLEELLSPTRFPLGKLGESARYTTLAGGKRLRPRLAIATAELYNVPLERALPCLRTRTHPCLLPYPRRSPLHGQRRLPQRQTLSP